MARELSQEELLDFLCQAGGRVTNAALLGHFRGFLRDPGAAPGQLQQRRELFKSLVNSVAAVRQDPDGTKCVVLKKRYRDLVGEEGLRGPRGDPPLAAPQQPPPRPAGAAPASPGSRRRAPRQRQPPQSPQRQPRPQRQLAQPQCPQGQQPPSPQRQPQRQQPQPQPQPGRARRQPREPEPETQPAGAGTTAPEIELNGLAATPGDAPESTKMGREGVDRNPGRQREAAATGPSPQARGLAAAGAQGDYWRQGGRESPWTGCTEPHLLSHGSPPVEEVQALKPSSAQCEGIPNSSTGSSTKSPPLAREPFRASEISPSLAAVAFPGDRSELLTLSGLHSYAAQQQQERTREWVANHSQASPGSVAEGNDLGPSRFWCVLPENFLQLPSSWEAQASERLLPSLPTSSPPLPSGASVFRSIRCQLDLQNLENFVEEDSHGSEESTSDPRESPGELEDTPKVPLGDRAQENLRTPSGQFIKSQQETTPLKSQGPIFRSDCSVQHIPARVNGSVVLSAGSPRESSRLPQDPVPCPATRLKRSLRRSSRAEREKVSSSDEELLKEDLVKRNRRPPRSRKLSRAGAVPSPKVDAPLSLKPTIPKAVTEQRLADSFWVPPGNVSSILVSLRPSVHKSSMVPLDSREHEWIVRLASGAWRQALTLFWEDPQLALRKDFLTGYTALHWIAKHGALQALQELVRGAQKAGIVLDVNVRSSCGYTPLHLAALHGHQGVIKLLVQKLESRVNVRDSSGKKPWQYLTSNTTGEIWKLLGAPRGKPIFPVHSLVSSSPTRKGKSHDVSRNISRKASLAALLKSQHNRWRMAHQYDRFRTSGERDEHSD